MQIISPVASFILAYAVFWFTKSMKYRDIQRDARNSFEDCLDNLLRIRQERAMLAVDRPNEVSAPSFDAVNRAYNSQRNYYVNRATEILNRHKIELFPREMTLIANETFDDGNVTLAKQYLNDAIKISDNVPMMKADALLTAGSRFYEMGDRTVGFERLLEALNVLKKLSDSTTRVPERVSYRIAETYLLLADLKDRNNEYKAAVDFIDLAKEASKIMPSGSNRSRMDAIIEIAEKRIVNRASVLPQQIGTA